jgi:hypothetical protein
MRCSNPECESHTGTTPMFICRNLLCDADKDLLEDIKKIEADYFECAHCGYKAEEIIN